MNRLPCVLVLLALASGLAAQRVLRTVFGTTTQGGLGTVTRAAGDVDGDGVGDFVVSAPTNSEAGFIDLISGATLTPLARFVGDRASGMWGLGTRDVSPIGDVNGDGRIDFAAGYVNRDVLDVFSGASGARLYRMGPALEFMQYACSAGDLDADGKDDFIAYIYNNSRTQLWTVRGVSGSPLTLLSADESSSGILRNVGDLNGDGRPEIVSGSGQTLSVFDPFRALRLRQIPTGVTGTVSQIEVADWNNDGRMDVLLGHTAGPRQPFLTVVEAVSGGVLARIAMPAADTSQPTGRFAVLPDVDGDGHVDIVAAGAFDPLNTNTSGVTVYLSGATGRRIGAWPGTPQFNVNAGPIAAFGDHDGDGVGDFVIGNPNLNTSQGGWLVISGKIFAGMAAKPVNCYTGPFAPELGVTRPVLGQMMQIVGREAPAGSFCTLAFSLLPDQRTNLGVAGCDAWLDLGTLVVLANPRSTPTWQLAMPLPNVPLLVGLEVAFQAIYAGTTGPLGMDLSNGVWARLGY